MMTVLLDRLLMLLRLPPEALPVLPHLLLERALCERLVQPLRLRVVRAVLLHRHTLQPARHLLRLRVVLVHSHALSEPTHGRHAGGADGGGALGDAATCDAAAHRQRCALGQRRDQWLHDRRQVLHLPPQRRRLAWHALLECGKAVVGIGHVGACGARGDVDSRYDRKR